MASVTLPQLGDDLVLAMVRARLVHDGLVHVRIEIDPEAEAIALEAELGARWLLMDDNRAVEQARIILHRWGLRQRVIG